MHSCYNLRFLAARQRTDTHSLLDPETCAVCLGGIQANDLCPPDSEIPALYHSQVAWGDSGLIASGGYDRSVKVWDSDSDSLQERHSLTGERGFRDP